MNTVPEYTEEIARLILQRISGTIGEEEAGLLDAWRKADPANEETYRRLLDSAFLEREWRRMKSVDVARPLADMQAKIRRGNTRRLVNVWKYAGIAAAVVIGFIVGGVVFFRHDPQLPLTVEGTGERETALYASQIHPGETKATLTTDDGQVINLGADAAGNEKAMKKRREREKPVGVPRLNHLATPRGGEFEITLEDGTKVWLNSASRMTYPVAFGEKNRKINFAGEGYFEVAPDAQRPFIVEFDGMEIRVLGTEFNLNTRSSRQVRTVLVRGKVSVALEGGKQVLLQPGEMAETDIVTGDIRVKAVPVWQYTAWQRGEFAFENATIEEMLNELALWFDLDVVYNSEVVRKEVFTGCLSRNLPLPEILRLIENTTYVRFTVEGHRVIVSVSQQH